MAAPACTGDDYGGGPTPPTLGNEDGGFNPSFDPRGRRSIWHPRAKWSDAHDIFDTSSVEWSRFELDFQHVLLLGIARLIEKNDDGNDESENSEVTPEVTQVAKVLWEGYNVLCCAFSYYASANLELNHLTLNTYTQFIEDCKLASKKSAFCKKSDFDQLFIAVDTASMRLDKEAAALQKQQVMLGRGDNIMRGKDGGERKLDEVNDRQKAFSRTEFLAALVHMAINRYVKTKEVPDVSEALQRFVFEDVAANVNRCAMQDSNAFREAYAYSSGANAVLRWHAASLRQMFAGLAAASTDNGKGTLIDSRIFLRALEALQITGAGDVTERDAILCFAWSRMVVVDGRTHRGVRYESHLPFEGFLEALCRLAVLKALPTDEDLFFARVEHAGAFMDALEADDTVAYLEFIATRATPIGSEPNGREPYHRMLAHLLELIFHRIEVQMGGGSEGGGAVSISFKDMAKWMKIKGFEKH